MRESEFWRSELTADDRGIWDKSHDVWSQTKTLTRLRGTFVWTLVATSLSMCFGLLICIVQMPDVLSMRLYGDLTVGLVVLCAQLILTVGTFWAYCAWTAALFDERAHRLFDAASNAR